MLEPLKASRGVLRSASHGLSLVELLVGLALGLFVVASSIGLLAGHLRENRALVMESRLMQDLRVASDLITRDLRRAGHWGNATAGVWRPAAGASAAMPNPYTALAPTAAASDAVSFQFSRDPVENNLVDSNEQFGFRLRSGGIDMLLGSGNWQALTDATALTITAFSVTPTVRVMSLEASCPAPCPAGSAACPPRQSVRSLVVQLSGRAVGDANVVRTIRSQVRVRNDAVSGSCTS